jgi:hypothetical protein
MLFGQSIFQSVLDRLDAEEEGAPVGENQASHRIHGLNAGFATSVMEGVSAPSARPDQAYFDNMDFDRPQPGAEAEPDRPVAAPAPEHRRSPPEPSPLPEPPVMPAHLQRIRPEEVAAELAISSEDTIQSLGEKRRAFARANHPDSVAPPFRDNATARMKIANLLIDEATRRLNRAAARRPGQTR